MNRYTDYLSPLGTLILQANDHGLLGLWFEAQTTRPHDLGQREYHCPLLNQAIAQLADYFSGQRRQFSLPLAAQGSAFQIQVWQTLAKIPYGHTCSYQDIANSIGNPKAVRAVGSANANNPISIIVPCHRVIGKTSKLTGYAGGIERKRALLELELNNR
jgi:methylated-DNA-[protein]-cysteine S-methyltransferase